MIPPSLTRAVLFALAQAGEAAPITKIEPVKGGMVSRSWRIVTRRRSYLLKYHEDAKPFFYGYERYGLDLLREAGPRVPAIIASADKTETTPAYYIQEWIHPGSPEMQRRRLGQQLAEEIAELHLRESGAPGFGAAYSPTDGPGQYWHASWVAYLQDRVLNLIDRLDEGGRMDPERWEALERFAAKLPDLLDIDYRPSLLHGDLHMRNVLINRDNEPVLIDPTVLYGDREYETAYMHLWGFFPPAFWGYYGAVYPHPPEAAARRDIYLVVHMLLTLATVGPQFGTRLDAMVHRIVGYGRK